MQAIKAEFEAVVAAKCAAEEQLRAGNLCA